MFTSIPMVNCPVCGDKTRVSHTTKRFGDHIRRYRRCTGCGYSFITAQADEQELITDPLSCGYAGHIAKSQLTQAIK
jgi:rubredoxin